MSSSSVCLIILNYNGRRLLGKYLPALAATDYQPLEIVVVDNHSTDDSVGWLRARWPQITVLAQDSNLAWAGGNNVGIRYAMEKGHRYVVFANNDIMPHPGWIREAVAFSEAHPDYGIVGFQQFNEPKSFPAFETASKEPRLLAWHDTDHVPGCSLFCDIEIFRAVGLFDETYIFYAEENDLEMRVLKAGWRAAELNVPVWHLGEASTRRLGLKRAYLSMRNYVRLHLKLEGIWSGLRAAAVVMNRACNPYLKLDFDADYTLRRYRPSNLFTNGALALAAIAWNLVAIGHTLYLGYDDRRRIADHLSARSH